jgi:hypothetical protein
LNLFVTVPFAVVVETQIMTRAMMKILLFPLAVVRLGQSFTVLPVATPGRRNIIAAGYSWLGYALPEVWVEEADDDFVDEKENLEVGEVCLLSLKAFATDPDDPEGERFLCAGALVQRPLDSVCDAWTADTILRKGGPNLQLQGAVKLLDELFLHHLKRNPNSVDALRDFVLQCGASDSEYSCASHMAGLSRGFRPLREMVRINSIYEAEYYCNEDLDGMVFDYTMGKRRYEKVALTDDWEMAAEIWTLLPDPDTIHANIVVKEQEQDL